MNKLVLGLGNAYKVTPLEVSSSLYMASVLPVPRFLRI